MAQYIITKNGGPLTAMKLQKLVYYSQAWSLVWDERPLFHENIEAWANGPVVPDLYRCHKGQFLVAEIPGSNLARLDKDGTETIDAVLKSYGDKNAHWLSELTHSERPWLEARKGHKTGEQCSEDITLEAMADYYSSLA